MSTPIVATGGAGEGSDRPDDPAPVDAPRRSRQRRWWALAAVVAVLGTATAAAFLVELPYYLVQPGSVRPAEQRVEITGAESFETDGEILFTTVFITRATPALMVRSWLDDAIEVRTEEEMYPEGDPDEARQRNRLRMDLSKLTATLVALEELGIDAELDGGGARVLAVSDDSDAAAALRVDDVIVEVDGGSVSLPDDIAQELSDRSPGDEVEVVVQRAEPGVGSPDPEQAAEVPTVEEEYTLRLGAAPDDSSRPVLGVQVDVSDPGVESPVEVEVDSGQVSGPSAGLAWTLAIIDRLTPSELTDGRRIAVTGTISADGSVGPVGGTPQKVAAVRRAGIDLFLYPAATPEEEQAEMRRIAGDDVELRPVDDVSDAVEVLAPGGIEQPA